MRLSRRNLLDVLVLLIIGKLVLIFFFPITNDELLVAFHDGTLPISYGVLWVLLNPLYWTQLPYKLWVFCFEQTMLLGLLTQSRYRLRHIVVFEALSLIYYMNSNTFQNVTVISTMPLAMTHPIFLLIPILQKLPIGWSWNPLDPSRLQLLQIDRGVVVPANEFDANHMITHAPLVIGCLYSILIWKVKDRLELEPKA